MTIQFSSLFTLLLLAASPLTASAQWSCSASRVTTIEFMPEVNVRRGGITTTEALDRHLPAADRALVEAEILALAHDQRYYCAHQLRVSVNYDADDEGYTVDIRVRSSADRCWEQVQCSVEVRYVPELGLPPVNATPLAAVREARAHGSTFCTAMLISCPGDPPLH